MASPRVILTVQPDGTVQAKTEGVTGPECLDYIEVLEDLLAANTVTSEFTADYHRGVTPAHNYNSVAGNISTETLAADNLVTGTAVQQGVAE